MDSKQTPAIEKADGDGGQVGDNMQEEIDVSSMTLMDALLGDAKSEGVTCTVFLTNGIKLIGKVIAYDKETIVYKGRTNTKAFGIARSSIATFLLETLAQPLDRERGYGNT